MLSRRMKRFLQVGAVISCVTALGVTSSSVYAVPSTGGSYQTASGLMGELNNLNSELDALSAEIDALSADIEYLAATMEATQQRMDEAQLKGEEQYEAMKLRIKYMYEAGNMSFLELLCSSEDMADFLNKSDFIQDVSEYDRNMLTELLETQEEIKKEGDALSKQHEELLKLQEELCSKRTDLESRISSTTDLLTKYQASLTRAYSAEQLLSGTSYTEAAQQAAQLNQGAGDRGNSNVGSSLGVFKITHYCPCYYCSGGWGSGTSTGAIATPGRTIAVDPNVIPYGSVVMINGYAYVAEDCGGAIKGNRIDIYVPDHATALALGVYDTEIFLVQ